MRLVLLVGAGGFIGTVLRYLVSQLIQSKVSTTFPISTLAINILGCFVIGLVFAYAQRGSLNADFVLFLATGVCGGFTTFSAFSNETLILVRGGEVFYAFIYVATSLVLGLLATFSAIKLFGN